MGKKKTGIDWAKWKEGNVLLGCNENIVLVLHVDANREIALLQYNNNDLDIYWAQLVPPGQPDSEDFTFIGTLT